MKENVFVLGPIWPLKKIPSNLYIYIDTRDSQAATVVSPYDAVRSFEFLTVGVREWHM